MFQELGFSGYKAEYDIVTGNNTRREKRENGQSFIPENMAS